MYTNSHRNIARRPSFDSLTLKKEYYCLCIDSKTDRFYKKEIADLFNATHPDHNPISKSK